MNIGKTIHRLRTTANLSQEQFASLFAVSQQAVQKWENNDSAPELSNLIKIAKHFGVSLDALVLGNDNRITEELKNTCKIKPQYSNMHDWEFYSSNLGTEYQQSTEEGLDIEVYKELFSAVSILPKGEIRKRFGDILFEVVSTAAMKENYPYLEPSTLEEIQALRKPYAYEKHALTDLESKIHGAWVGRICGCLLGKTVEGICTDELLPFLRETKNYPLHRYILRSDLRDDIIEKYKFSFASREYADTIAGAPVDDDTNYTVLYQQIIENYGKDFTPFDVSRAWLGYQPKDSYCTAERVAFCNFVKGFEPPESALYQNPYREWIGAQIRADYFGYINPARPALAAEMAWRDASISHVKNGIYGEMFVAAMLAIAAETSNIRDIILGALAEIPYTSRLYEQIMSVLDGFDNGLPKEQCFRTIHKKYDEYNSHDWCHTIPNAMIVVASLLYGQGNYAKSICMAVETGFDTDCNAATVGSVLGMANGITSIPDSWIQPLHDTLHTTIFGIGTVKISDRVRLTLKHIAL